MNTVLRSVTSALAGLVVLAGPVAGATATSTATTSPTAATIPSAAPTDGSTGSDQRGPTHSSVELRPTPAQAGPAAAPDETRISARHVTATVTLGEGVHVVGLRWQGPATDGAELRLREPGTSWGDWHAAGAVVEAGRIGREQAEVARAGAGRLAPSAQPRSATNASGSDPDLLATEGSVVVGPAELQVRLPADAQGATLETWTSYPTAEDARTVADLPVGGEGLAVGTRADWGADESLRGTDPAALLHDSPKLGVTVHHTATVNGYSAEQVPAMLRSIYAYHAQTLDWGDIGYGTLVDRFGRAWEGRAGGIEHNVQLAHAYGMNTDWAGISVLGDHETAPVGEAELAKLAELTAWTLDTHGVDVTDEIVYTNRSEGWTRTMPAVHGHRDVLATTCPGYLLYEIFDQMRAAVGSHEDAGTHAVHRISGADRYASAAALARQAFLEGADTAYLASGETLVDALAVGPVAAEQDAAVLLTRKGSLPESTLAAIDDLGISQVRIVGGEAAISATVAEQLAAHGLYVRRFEGPDRYAVAARLAQEAAADGSVPETVYLASGEVLPDALSGAAAAAEQRGAVLLTRPGQLPAASAEQLGALDPARVVVLGGTAAVADTVVQEVAALLPGAVVDRIGGTNRYGTSALVAADAFGTASSAVAAAGDAPADAMVGTQLAARHDAPLVLVRPACRPGAVDAVYDDLGVRLTRLAGGDAVLDWAAGATTCG